MTKLVLKGDLAKRIDFLRALRATKRPTLPLSLALIVLNRLVDTGQADVSWDISAQDREAMRELGVVVE